MKSFLSFLRQIDSQVTTSKNRQSRRPKSIGIALTTMAGLGSIAIGHGLTPTTAQAAPVPLSLFQTYLGKVDYRLTGGTLRTQPNGIDPCATTTSSTGVLSAIPPGATIKQAYLYWGASQNGPNTTSTVTFQNQSVTAQQVYTDTNVSGSAPRTFYGNRADVTSIVNTNRNATYTFKNLNFSKVSPFCETQTVLGAWSLIVIYDDPTTIPDYRYLNLYEGFVLSQNQVVNFTVDKIKVATNPVAFFTFLGWEGDATLGGANETLRFNGSTITNSLNPNTQQFNSTITSPPAQGLNLSNTYGVDLDTYDVKPYVVPGATSVTGTISTMQDLVIQQAALVSVSTQVADLELTQAVPVVSGASVTFTLTLTNKGPDAVTAASVKDLLPAGLTFVSAAASAGTYNATTGIWTVGAMAVNDVRTLTIVATATPVGAFNYTNIAQVTDSSLPDIDSTPNNNITTEDDYAARTISVTGVAPVSKSISGTVFEDINYGGGSGRSLTTSSGRTVAGAVVELYRYESYAPTGNQYFYVTSTTTNSSGKYQFTGLGSATQYVIRVVNDSVNSNRSGTSGSELGIQTFRTNAASGVVDVTNAVGGVDPVQTDSAQTTTACPGTTSYDSTYCWLNLTTGVIRYTPGSAPATVIKGFSQSFTEVIGTGSATGVDFGYNFDTIVNKNNTGQGSLRQFIANSNLLGDESLLAQSGNRKAKDGVTNELLPIGTETSIFMIPDGAAHNGLVASTSGGPASQIAGSVAQIAVPTALPAISGTNANNTSIDGTTQTVNISDSNSGSLGTTGTVTVGVNNLALSKVQKPEILLNSTAGGILTGLDIQANNVTVRGMGIYGFGSAIDNGTDIQVTSGNNAVIEQNIIGATPTTLAAPTSFLTGIGINVRNGNNGQIHNNLIGQTFYAGISFSVPGYAATAADGWQIDNNELFGSSTNNNTSADGFVVGGNTGKFTLSGNLIKNYKARGIDLNPAATTATSSGSGWTIDNNTIDTNGLVATQPQGIFISAKDNTNPSFVTNNIIKNNAGAGIAVADGSTVQKIKISQNSFTNNIGNAIDLSANGITLNNANTVLGTPACGYETTFANQRIDFPLFNRSKLTGTTLTVTGQACPNSRVEVYKQYATSTTGDTNATLQYGEGETYLGFLTSDSSGFFGGDLNVSGKLVAADKITGITIDSNSNTSEFNNGVPVNTLGVAVSGNLYTSYSANNNFILDPTEPLLGAGVTVQLKNGLGTVINTTTTDANGFYKFPDVTVGIAYTINVPSTVDDLTIAANGISASNTISLTLTAGTTTDVLDQNFGYSFPIVNAAICSATNGTTFAGTPSNQILAFNPTTGGSIVAATTPLAADTSALAHNQSQKLVYYAQGASIYAWDYTTPPGTHTVLNITDLTSAGTTLIADGVTLNANGGGMAFVQNGSNREIYLGVGNVDAAGQQFGLYRLKLDATGKVVTKISKIDILKMASKAANFTDEWGDLVVTGSGDVYGITKNQGLWKFNLTTGGFSILNPSLAGTGKSLFLSNGTIYVSNPLTKSVQAIDSTGNLVGLPKIAKAIVTDGSECGAAYATDLKIVQRITNINSTDLNTINDPGDNQPAIATAVAASTPPNFLRGKWNGGLVKSGDIVEYTTYFTADGTSPTGTVNICSLVPKEAEFVPNAYGTGTGMQVTFIRNDGTVAATQILSNIEDNDGGGFVNKNTNTSGACLIPPSLTGSPTSLQNYEGAVTVNIVKSGGTLPDPTFDRPKQGFIRFKVRVK
jgi:uncharacterized repeat protein (TIGR01451 family)